MVNANNYTVIEVDDCDNSTRRRIEDAIEVMKDIVEAVSKCRGDYYGYGIDGKALPNAIEELTRILEKRMLY